MKKIICPNCKYEGAPKYRTSSIALWGAWFFIGGACTVFGFVIPVLYVVPVVLFIVAVIGTVINSTKGPIYCPRCRFANVIPQDEK